MAHARRHGRTARIEAASERYCRFRLPETGNAGAFGMDGDIARVNHTCDLADKYGAMGMVDDSPATLSDMRIAR